VIALDERRGARLSPESLDGRSGLLREELQGQALAGVFVLDLVDDPHSPLAEEAERAVLAANPRREIEQVGQRHLRGLTR
jgi:hypothetical protein